MMFKDAADMTFNERVDAIAQASFEAFTRGGYQEMRNVVFGLLGTFARIDSDNGSPWICDARHPHKKTK